MQPRHVRSFQAVCGEGTQVGWLVGGVLDPLRWIVSSFRAHDAGSLGAAGAIVVALLWIAYGWRRRRHVRRARLQKLKAAGLRWKEQVRLRLEEPTVLFAEHAHPGPTLGAREIFERDIEAAASAILVESGGRRAKAKELLRQRVNGNGAVKLNGSAALAWRQLGALSFIDSTRAALAAYSRAADLSPDDPDAHMLLGVLHMRAGNLEAAEAAFKRQIELGDGTESGAVARYRGRTMLGDVLVASNRTEEALQAYEIAQREVSALLQEQHENAALQRNLSVTHDRIGDVLAARGDLDNALESYQRGFAIAHTLAKRDPENLSWQRDLSVGYDRIGDVLDKKGDLQGALQSYSQGLAIAERLARSNGEDLQRQWDLSVSHDRIGDILLAQEKVEQALASFGRGLEIAEMLVEHDPRHTGWQRDLAVSYHKIGSIEAARGNTVEAREFFERGRAIIARLERIAAYRAQWRSDLSSFDEALQALDA
jgi:tetratricopeptide (TPR) repeat protein